MEFLAINGQPPLIPKTHTIKPYPQIGRSERSRMEQVLDSGILWAPWAPMTRELEKTWASRNDVKYCRALSSGTAALHCALVGCGVGRGDEVLVPAYGYLTSASTVLLTGATPVFVDVAPDGLINPSAIERSITHKTKAVVAVHLHGAAADMTSILRISQKFNLSIVEDCAQSPGATHNNRLVGSIGTVGAFSLNATKTLSGGEGGLLTTNDSSVFNLSALLSVFSTETSKGGILYRGPNSMGFNYRTNEFCSAFTLGRLEKFDVEKRQRIDNALTFISMLTDLPGLVTPIFRTEGEHTYSMFRIRLDPSQLSLNIKASVFREKLLKAMIAEGMAWWIWERQPLPNYPIFQIAEQFGFPVRATELNSYESQNVSRQLFPEASAISDDALFTTAHFPGNEELLIKYAIAMRKIWKHMDEVLKIPVADIHSQYQTPF